MRHALPLINCLSQETLKKLALNSNTVPEWVEWDPKYQVILDDVDYDKFMREKPKPRQVK